jgi:V8-like Glu-specific endopeptidase
MLIVALLVAVALPATAVALTLRGHGRHPASGGPIPTATRSRGLSEVGPLYASAGAREHGCTASVVRSPRGNVLVTAAHCVQGSAVGMVFVPGQRGAGMPYGRWIVTAAYLEPEWLAKQDPHADIAFLTVAPRRINGLSTQIERVTGAYDFGSTAVPGRQVRVTGYPAGGPDDPITCRAKVYLTQAFPSFDCHGFVAGTSGSPWLQLTRHGTQIVGVIGGLHQGGCREYASYGSPLGRAADEAYDRAAGAARADDARQPDGDGC